MKKSTIGTSEYSKIKILLIFGGIINERASRPETNKICFLNKWAGRTRTYDRRIMSPLL